MLRRINYFILFLILLGGLSVRLYKLDRPLADWHSWRQTDTASVTRIYLNEGIDLLHPKFYDLSLSQSGKPNPQGYRFVEFPIYNLLTVYLLKIFPQIPLREGSRLVSIFFSLISACVIYLIGKKIAGEKVGLLGSFFFAFIPYNVFYSSTVLPESTMIAFALSSIWFFLKFLEGKKLLFLAATGVFTALAILIKPYIIFFELPIIYLAFNKWGKGVLKMKSLWIAGAVSLIPFLLWRLWMLKFPEGIPHFLWAFNGDGIRFRPAFWRWIFGERIGTLILGIWGVVPFVFGILKKKNNFILVFLGSIFLYFAVVASANVRHDYYQVIAVPAICLTLATGSVYMWKSEFMNKFLSRIVLVFCITMMFGMGAYQIKEYYKIDHPEIMEAGRAVNELTPKTAKIIAPYNQDTAFLYQTRRYGWPVVDESIETLIGKGAQYFVSVNFRDPDTINLMDKYEIVKKTDNYVIIDLSKAKSK